MTRDDIIRMLRKSHLDVYGLGKDHEKFVSVVERFANLVAAAEREACAKLCRSIADYFREHKDDMPPDLFDPVNAVLECDIAIRKRGAL